MRILQSVADGRPGGGTTLVLSLIRFLVERGEDEVHALGQRDSYFIQEAKKLGANVHEAEFWRSRFDRTASRAVSSEIETIAPDLAHFHGSRAAFFAMKAISSRKFPSVYTVHGFHFHQKKALLRRLAVLAESRICQAVGHVVFVCEDDRRLAKELGILADSHPSSVIYNGFDPSGLPEKGATDPNKVVYLGRLNPQKDPLLMVEIAAILSNHRLHTTLIGGGEMEADVVRRIEELGIQSSVKVTGILPRDEALKELATASVFVLPSRWEGFPISILESMAIGVPVLASAVNGVPEAIEDRKTGLLVRSQSAQDFADAVLELKSNKELQDSIVDSAKSLALEKFSLSRCMEQHGSLYASLRA